MKNNEIILAEIKNFKILLARFLGTEDLPEEQKFSDKVLDKLAKEFRKLNKERSEWVESYNIDHYIKGTPYTAGNFIRTEFGFKNFFKRGQKYYYSRRDLIALNKELKKRNVDLRRFMELREDQEKFKKYVASIITAIDSNKSKKPFRLPSELKDIITSPPKQPDPEILRARLKQLQDDFFAENLSEYIDIYNGNHAMPKYIYMFEKYIDPKLRRRIHRWTHEFDLLNTLLKEITKKKEKFIPVQEDKMIRL